MPIVIQGRGDIRMAQNLLDRLWMDIVRDQERCTPMAQIVKRVVFGNPAFTNHDPAPCLGAGHVARAAQGVAHAVKVPHPAASWRP